MEAIGSLFRDSLSLPRSGPAAAVAGAATEQQNADDLEERTSLPPSPSRSPLRKKRNKGGIINATDDAVVEDSAAADLSSQLSQMNAERSADVVKGCQSFLLSSVLNESEEVNVSIVFCCSSFVVLFHTNSHSFSHFVLWGHSLMKWLMVLLLITMSSRIAVEVVCSLTMDHSALHQLQH